MGPQDEQGDDRQQASDAPQQGEHATDSGGPEGAQVIGTDNPLIEKGPAFQSDWAEQPDRSMVIQTSGIREPNQAFSPNFVMVPVEADRPSRDRSGPGHGEGNVGGGESEKGGRDKGSQERGDKDQGGSEGQDRAGDRQKKEERGRPSQGPSLIKIMLLSGVTALVCGVAGAWGYSYFFGPDKSGGKSSGQDSGSGGGSGSSKDSGGGSGSSKDSGGGSGSDKGTDTRKNSTSNDKNQNAGKLAESQMAWLAAVKELREAKEAEKEARKAEGEKKAILDFLKNTLLTAGNPASRSLSSAFWAGGQGQDVTLRKALDSTESQVGDAFKDRPTAEAAVREMLGLAYLNIGDLTQGVRQYERALALREAVQGDNHPETAACRNQLAFAYRIAGRTNEAGRLFEVNPNSPDHAAALAVRASILLAEKKPADAELKLRECLAIDRKIQPDDWQTFDAESMLGEALLQQRKFDEAEPLLVSGYEGLQQRADKIPPAEKNRLKKALERLVSLYEARGDPIKAAKWRDAMQTAQALRQP